MTTPVEPGWETLQKYVNADSSDQSELHWAVQEAGTLVTSFVGTAPVPETIIGRAILETAAAIWHRKQNQNGIAGFNGDGVPVFYAKDPMNSVYPMLRRWVLPF